MRLRELASVIRSKNAGPFTLTLDVMFDREESYRQVLSSGLLTPERIAQLYQVEPARVRVISYEPAWAIKVTMPRRLASGDPQDTDVYATQQHVLLLDLVVPEAQPGDIGC